MSSSSRCKHQTADAPTASVGSSACTLRQTKPPPQRTATGGAECMGNQARRNTSVPLVPPKPKLFFTATSIFIGRASLAQ